MVTIPWWFVKYGFPVLALGAVTAFVLFSRPALQGGDDARPTATASVVEQTAPKRETKRARATAYSVRSGDTLASIADKFGTSVDRLMELNPGLDPTALRVGEPIRVA